MMLVARYCSAASEAKQPWTRKANWPSGYSPLWQCCCLRLRSRGEVRCATHKWFISGNCWRVGDLRFALRETEVGGVVAWATDLGKLQLDSGRAFGKLRDVGAWRA